MTEGGRNLHPDPYILTGALLCAVSGGLSLAFILAGIGWIMAKAGGG